MLFTQIFTKIEFFHNKRVFLCKKTMYKNFCSTNYTHLSSSFNTNLSSNFIHNRIKISFSLIFRKAVINSFQTLSNFESNCIHKFSSSNPFKIKCFKINTYILTSLTINCTRVSFDTNYFRISYIAKFRNITYLPEWKSIFLIFDTRLIPS